MSQPTWNRSHWALVVVVILLLGIVAVKHTTARQSPPAPAPATPTEITKAIAATTPHSSFPQETAAQPSGEPLPGSELDAALKSGRPTVVDFGAGWCQQCKKMVPVLAEAVGKYDGKATIVFVNTDDYPAVAKGYRVSAIPTQVLFDAKGQEVGRHVGYYPIEDLDAQLKSLGLIE